MSKADAVPWWLVPNVLALDAPAVAVAWQRFLGGRAGAAVPWAASAALAAAAWAVYLADRRLDAARGRLDADRHRVAARWPGAFAAGAVLAAALALAAASQLPAAYLRYGLAVALGVDAADSIDAAEDRERFDALLEQLSIKRPQGKTVKTEEQALQAARPSIDRLIAYFKRT